jgi:hypothetical protein
MNRTREDTHGTLITKVDSDSLMDEPGPTSSAILMRSKVMAVEEATLRIIPIADTRKKDAPVPTTRKDSGTARTGHTATTNTRARPRVDRAMGIIPSPTTTPRGLRSMTTVRAPRGAARSMGAVTATASARGAMEDANTDALMGTMIALAETDMGVRRMRALDAGLGVMGATRLLAPRG